MTDSRYFEDTKIQNRVWDLQASHASLENQWGVFRSESDDTEHGRS